MSAEAEPAIRVVVADDQAIIRDGLVTVLGLLPDVEVVGAAADGAEAVALAVSAHPDVLLMDLRMPVLDGVAATARVAEIMRILTPDQVRELTKLGAGEKVTPITPRGQQGAAATRPTTRRAAATTRPA